MTGSFVRYNRYSLLAQNPNGPFGPFSGDRTHVSNSQIVYASYFYKLLSVFTPLYLCLFLSLILFPTGLMDPAIKTTRVLYFRVLLACSFVFFFWLTSGMRRCRALFRDAFRARRISVQRPWPLFPEEDKLGLFAGRKYIHDVIFWSSMLMSATNIVLFAYRYGTSPTNYDPDFWWQPLDLHLMAVTMFVFFAWLIYLEADLRNVLHKARLYDPLNK